MLLKWREIQLSFSSCGGLMAFRKVQKKRGYGSLFSSSTMLKSAGLFPIGSRVAGSDRQFSGLHRVSKTKASWAIFAGTGKIFPIVNLPYHLAIRKIPITFVGRHIFSSSNLTVHQILSPAEQSTNQVLMKCN